MKNIITTTSQYMVVAVSLERYVVICHKTVTSLKQHYYTGGVVIFSLIVNVPKFFELERHHPILNEENASEAVVLDQVDVKDQMFSLTYQTSRLGENQDWFLFSAYHEICVITFCLLVICYCNYQVWLQITKSAQIQKDR